MKKKYKIRSVLFLLASIGLPLQGRPLVEAPMNIQAALVIKLLAYNTNVNQGDDLVVYVIGAPKFAQTMKPAIGRAIGNSKLSDVVVLERPPQLAPTAAAVLYVGDPAQLDNALAYCRKHQILSITGLPALMDKGVTLRVGVEQKKPAILLSTALSQKEGVKWDKKVFLIASDE